MPMRDASVGYPYTPQLQISQEGPFRILQSFGEGHGTLVPNVHAFLEI